MQAFGKLRGRLHELGLHQQDIANALGLSNSAVSHRFHRLTPWTLQEMYAILDLCRAKPEEMHIYFPREEAQP